MKKVDSARLALATNTAQRLGISIAAALAMHATYRGFIPDRISGEYLYFWDETYPVKMGAALLAML